MSTTPTLTEAPAEAKTPATAATTAAPATSASAARTTVTITLDESTFKHFETAAIADERSLSKYLARELKKLAGK